MKIGAYSCEIYHHLGKWFASDFRMGVYGLDVSGRDFKHKSSAIRFAKKVLQRFADRTLKNACLR